MNTSARGIASIAFGALLCMMTDATAQQQPVVLKFNLWVPPTHHFHQRINMPWAEDVAKATEGRVKIEFTPSSLGAPPRQYDLARSGVADITSGNHGYTPGRFPLTEIAELPFVTTNAEATSVAYWRTYMTVLDKAGEHRDVKLLGLYTHGPVQIFTTDKKVERIDDLKGVKMVASGPVSTNVIQLLGGTAVSIPVTQMYEMFSRGVVDGVPLSDDTIRSFKLEQFLKRQTRVSGGLFNASFFLVMNKAKWDQLPKRDQDAIMSVSGETFARRAGSIWDDQDRIAQKERATLGTEITTASAALMKDLHERLKVVEIEWVKAATKSGVDGQRAVEMFKKEVAEHRSR